MTAQFKAKTGSRGIEWCDRTCGVFGGCMHGCQWELPGGQVAICYAKELAEKGVAKAAYPNGFEYHYFRPAALRELVAGKNPELVFIDSMADAFAVNVPPDQVRLLLATMEKAPHKTFQSLTKAAPQLLKYLDAMPGNLWVGVSSPPDWFMGKRLSRGTQEAMLRRSLEVLAEVKARTRCLVWMSAEPVSWDLTAVIDADHPLDWVVIGAASAGPRYFQPSPVHVRHLLDVLDGTGTPVFYKGNIAPLFAANDLGSPALNRWREDFPTCYRDGTPIPAVVRRQEMCRRHGWTLSLPVVDASQGDLFGGKL